MAVKKQDKQEEKAFKAVLCHHNLHCNRKLLEKCETFINHFFEDLYGDEPFLMWEDAVVNGFLTSIADASRIFMGIIYRDALLYCEWFYGNTGTEINSSWTFNAKLQGGKLQRIQKQLQELFTTKIAMQILAVWKIKYTNKWSVSHNGKKCKEIYAEWRRVIERIPRPSFQDCPFYLEGESYGATAQSPSKKGQ